MTPIFSLPTISARSRVILVCLDNIQAHLENPFDQVGEDDVMINAENSSPA